MIAKENLEQEAASNNNPHSHLFTLFHTEILRQQLNDEVFAVSPEELKDLLF